MRLHLIISRHGLPATRILWTTTSSTSALGEYGSHRAASTSAIASTRTPNIAFSNGGYTIAQLLEDVNEVVPLETEPSLFDPEFSGQWGLEDYVVEVGGSECLHFMEVEGILRDGDEVVIRALQLADLRARRLCGRHQITADGKHLIDGVPFGSPFLKRSTSSRPAITIPPRKKRRTVFSGWHHDPASKIAYEDPNANADEEGDGEWLPPGDSGFGKELSILPPEHEVSDMGTVIRHPVDHSGESDSDVDPSDMEEDELESELKALKEDFEEPASQFIDIRNQGQVPAGPALRSSSVSKRPSSSDTQRRGSLVGASSLSSKRSRGEDQSPRTSKAVHFNKGDQNVPEAVSLGMPQRGEQVGISESESEEADSTSSASTSSDSSEEDSSEEEEEEVSDSESDSSDSTSDSSSEESSSESEEKEVSLPPQKRSLIAMNPPGEGSIRTKKSNHRCKLRRRLSKLKELGVLPAEADFAAMRQWMEANGGWHIPEEASTVPAIMTKEEKKEQEQRDFEAKRQKLLRDLAAGGVDVDETSEKENVPPQPAAAEQIAPEKNVDAEKPEAEPSNRRQLDIASSRRLLFGSLGMRTPKTKEDEEAARSKLAAQASAVQNRKKPAEVQPAQEEEDESDVAWQNKLIIRATECVYDDIELSAPPFPFENRWDDDADKIIRQRKGWGKKRKRKQRIQVYNGDVDQDEYEDPNEAYEANMQLDYGDEWPEAHDEPAMEPMEKEPEVVDDLPELPEDMSSVADLLEPEAKVGAIIAFRQLDMSKATNWQPQMSEYRVAEVHGVSDGILNVRLAVRNRRQRAERVDEDQPRQYSKFEMPGYEDDEEEDDGYRELAFAELSDPKLLRPAQDAVEDASTGNGEETKEKATAAEEGSIVSVVEDSMPNAQLGLSSGSVDMDLDDTTFVTGVTAASQNGSPARASDAASVQTPGGVRLPHTHLRDPDDEQSDSPAVPSPIFSGFHSARSSPGAMLANQCHGEIEEGNLEGHTLVGESQSILADTSNQDHSALSFLSAHQSTSDQPSESQQQDRQVVEDSLVHTTGSGENGTDSLLSIMPHQGGDGHSSPRSSQPRSVDGSLEAQKESTPKSPSRWQDILNLLKSGQPEQDHTDHERDERDDTNDDREDHDSLVHSEQSLGFSPRPSPPVSSLRSSRRPPPSAQRPQSQASPPESLLEGAPAASTRSKKPTQSSDSQPNASQFSEVIDLTLDSPAPSNSEPRGKGRDEGSGWVSKPEGDEDTLPRSPDRPVHGSAGKVQRLKEVSISPGSSQRKKKGKKRLSQKG